MTRLAEIQGRIAGMAELEDIVGAMRSLAGMRVQEAQRSLEAVRRYAQSTAAGIGAALALVPDAAPQPPPARTGRALVLCLAEHGFVGAFNERLLDAVAAERKPSDLLFILGSRGAALAAERGQRVDWSAPMATRPAGAPDAVNRLSNELYRRLGRGELARIEVIYGRCRQGAPALIERRALLPVDTAALDLPRPRQAPLHNLEPRRLLERLIAEYVFALLIEAAVESIAGENAARFAAMESAHDNVGKKLAALREAGRQARQSEITAELLDLLTGVQAARPAKA